MSSTPQTVGATLTVGALEFPAGSAVDHIAVTATGTNSANSQTVSVPAQSAAGAVAVSFTLAPDSYVLSAVALSSSGAEFGSPVTGTPNPLVITAPATVTLLVPTALSSP